MEKIAFKFIEMNGEFVNADNEDDVFASDADALAAVAHLAEAEGFEYDFIIFHHSVTK